MSAGHGPGADELRAVLGSRASLSETSPAIPGSSLADAYLRIRRASEALAAPLSPEDCQVQSMPDASPAKWHLAHTTWFFETFVLEPHEPAFAPFDARLRVLYNSDYQGIGAQHPQAQRGLVSRPTLDAVVRWRATHRVCPHS